MSAIELQVNGTAHAVQPGTTLQDLLSTLQLPETALAVELNRAVVQRSAFATLVLNAGDRVEIVTLVGGG